MNPKQILEMITANRRFIKMRSNIALHNLAMLHRSFDHFDHDECRIALALNDSEAAILFSTDYARGIEISEATLARYAGSPYTFYIACHESLVGRCYTFQTVYDRSLSHLLRARDMAYALPHADDEVRGLRADILSNLAQNGHHSGVAPEQTIGYLQLALQELEHTDMANRKGVCLTGIGNIYAVHGREQECLNHHMQALPLFEDAENYTNIATASCNIGSSYVRLGLYDLADKYLRRAHDLRSRFGSYWEIGNVYYHQGLLYEARGDQQLAYDTMLIARDYAMVSQARGIQTMILEKLAEMARSRGDEAAATTHLMRLTEVETAMAA